MSDLKTAIGLMSGTSMDGIDVALVRTDGEAIVERGPSLGLAYPPDFRKRLAQTLEVAKAITQRDERPGSMMQTERELTLRHAEAIKAFLGRFNIPSQDVDFIGFHGQTVLHRPQQGLSVQIGNGQLLATETGISVVYDMRANDMVHGGQGAPLVPVYHAALAAGIEGYGGKPVMFVNIGGISNLTFIGSSDEIIAFDSGPGNTLIDQWVEDQAGVPYDQGGAIASEGVILGGLAERYLANPFFTSEKRISLDRNDFQPPDAHEAGLHDGARTLAYVTAAAIAKSTRHLPEAPALVIVCGGGRLNTVIMADLNVMFPEARVAPAEDFGFNGDSMEAEAWAYLAVRSSRGLPLTFPGTTGVKEAVTGGVTVGPVFLETERLILTHWKPDDAVLVQQLHSQPESVRYLADGQPWTLERAEERMASWIAEFKRDGIGMLKLAAKEDGRFIGRAGVHHHRSAEVYGLSFSILPEEAGKGYATEIGRALMAWFAASRPKETLRAASDVNNLASLRVLEKMGMQEFELENNASTGDNVFFEMRMVE